MAVNPGATRGRGAERPSMTVQEYLAFEAMGQEKHEYVGGWVYVLYPEGDGIASRWDEQPRRAGQQRLRRAQRGAAS